MIKDILKSKMRISCEDMPKEDRDAAVKLFSQLKEIRGSRRIRDANSFNTELVKDIKNKIKNITYTINALEHSGRNANTYVFLDGFQTLTLPLADRKKILTEAYKSYLAAKKQERENSRKLTQDNKTELGFEFTTCGGVFSEPNKILALQTPESQAKRIKLAKSPSKSSTKNYVGIELEFVCRIDKNALEKVLCESYLGGYVYVHRDGSIVTENSGDVAHEVTVLAPEDKYSEIVDKLCKVLNSKAVGAYVNNSCGLHVHFDARNRNAKLMYSNFVSVLPLARQMVPKNRVSSAHAEEYCRMNTRKDFEEHLKLDRARYHAINPAAFSRHQTIEVRLHSGTLNATKIKMWIALFLNVARTSEPIKEDITTVVKYMHTFGMDTKLAEYILARIKLFGDKPDGIDTRADHFLFNEVAV